MFCVDVAFAALFSSLDDSSLELQLGVSLCNSHDKRPATLFCRHKITPECNAIYPTALDKLQMLRVGEVRHFPVR